MADSFGARMRQRREQQQIALSAIADQTKIKLSHLQALERDDLSHWPSGIFRRAFVRAYAHAIGLEPDVVVREFLEAHPDPVDEAASAANGEAAPLSAGSSSGLRYFVGTAIDSLSRLRPGAVPRRESIAPREISRAAEAPAATEPALAEPVVERVEAELLSERDVDLEPALEAIQDASAVERVPVVTAPDPDLSATAQWCLAAARAEELAEASPLLQEAVRILDAVGMIVWAWNERGAELTPVLAHGYPEKVLAQLPRVPCDADNATAAAFRSAQICVVHGGDFASGAVVVPLMTPAGCSGALAIELRHGSAQKDPVRAVATIFAAQLARLVPRAASAAADRRLA